MSAKSDAIAAAKKPVSDYMAKRAAAMAAVADLDAAAAPAVSKLIEVSGQSGPFKFDTGGGEPELVVFRKPRDGNGSAYYCTPYVERETL